MKPFNLVHTADFIRRAKDFDLDIRRDYYRDSGLKIGWMYVGDKSNVTACKQAFNSEGVPRNHSFRRVPQF